MEVPSQRMPSDPFLVGSVSSFYRRSIQPQGFLLAIDRQSRKVVQWSRNIATILGFGDALLASLTLDELIEKHALESIASFEQTEVRGLPCSFQSRWVPAEGKLEFEGLAHLRPGLLILELMPINHTKQRLQNNSWSEPLLPLRLRRGLQRLQAALNLEDLLVLATAELRELTGYDRVFACRTDNQQFGHVVAESHLSCLDSRLGRILPPEAFPRWTEGHPPSLASQLIANSTDDQVPLNPATNSVTGECLDLHGCVFASPSPVQIEVLNQLKISASLCIPLRTPSKHYGWLLGHHHSGKKLSLETWAACELLGGIVSSQIAAMQPSQPIPAATPMKEFSLGNDFFQTAEPDRDATEVGSAFAKDADWSPSDRFDTKETHAGDSLYDKVTAEHLNDWLSLVNTNTKFIDSHSHPLPHSSQFQAFQSQFQQLIKESQTLMYSIAHNFKEPLRHANQALFFLEAALTTPVHDEMALRLARVRLAHQRMDEVIQALLRLTRFGHMDLHIEPVHLKEVVDQAAELTIGRHPPAEIQLTVEQNDVIYADFMCLREVFVNLLTNALRYNASPTKEIVIGLVPAGHSPSEFAAHSEASVIFVRDNGIGIALEHQRIVFEPFRKLSNFLHPIPEASGVGLAIVKGIVERHQGRVWIDSQLGLGTTFYFSLGRPPT